MDAGHAYRARTDIPAFFSRHAARIDGMHLRDFKNDDQVPLGEGEFDLKPLVAAVERTGWPGWIINEEERLNDVKPGDAAVAPARKQVRKLFGV
jgi:sugar phosphate isomerase/epimerase